jgi:hypothetical protein
MVNIIKVIPKGTDLGCFNFLSILKPNGHSVMAALTRIMYTIRNI